MLSQCLQTSPHYWDMDHKHLLLQNITLVYWSLPVQFLVSSGSVWVAKSLSLQAESVVGELHLVRGQSRQSLPYQLCSVHVWLAHGWRIATYIHTNIHKHNTGDFLLCTIYVWLASARLNQENDPNMHFSPSMIYLSHNRKWPWICLLARVDSIIHSCFESMAFPAHIRLSLELSCFVIAK